MTSHATLNGNITDIGGENCDQRGFDWDTDSGAPYANSWTENGSFGTGAFDHQVTGLPENTQIYFRAKAHNSAGWGYGSELSFWTVKVITATDSAVGAESVTITGTRTLTVSDSAVGGDQVSVERLRLLPTVQDSAIGAEFAWRLKGSCLIDTFELPHVLSIRITDEAVISDKKIQGGSLPSRKMMGKPGRVVSLEGWTKSQTDIDGMRALKDGTVRTFIHPSGDSFAVLVTEFDADRAVDRYNRRIWRMTLAESKS